MRYQAIVRVDPFPIRIVLWVVLTALTTLLLAGSVAAQDDEGQGAGSSAAVEANNPLADMKAFNVQNYYIPELSGVDGKANTFWLRYAQPFGKWLLRASLPTSRVPTGNDSNTSGLGDFNAFLAYLFNTNNPAVAVGVGPLLGAPTATEDETGTGKWQAGLAGVFFDGRSPKFQWGGLLTYQTDFAGDKDRANTSLLVGQPFYFWQLGKGLYVRGAPQWVFNLEYNSYHVPMGLGIGKVMPIGGTVFNFFIEPQYTILDRGVGQPEFQIYAAVNMQFVGKKK